jgi:hypothetical protein
MQHIVSDTLRASKIQQCYRKSLIPPDVVRFINDNPLFAILQVCRDNPDVLNAYGDFSKDVTILTGI